jgi:LysR family transcriptional activator of glutamate synthase operon
VELRQLACVEAVARHRHFTRAADELHLAQSALSHQIRRLEHELGTPLFERTSRRVTVTAAGEAIAERARRVLGELDAARQEVDELRGVLRGHLRIGPLVPAGDVDVAGLLARFAQAHPGVEITLREGIAGDMFRFLAGDELDVAFCLLAGDLPDPFAGHRLGRVEIVAAFAADHAPRARRVGVAELARHRIVAPRRGSAITSVLEQRFADAGRQLHLALESGDPLLLQSLAARGFAAAILPRSHSTPDAAGLDVRALHPALHLPVALVRRRTRTISPAARAFVEFVRGETATTAVVGSDRRGRRNSARS